MKNFDDFDEEFLPNDFLNDNDNDGEINENYFYSNSDLSILRRELHQKLLFKVIKMCEKTWFWGLRTKKSQNNIIIDTFTNMKNLIDIAEYEDVEFLEKE